MIRVQTATVLHTLNFQYIHGKILKILEFLTVVQGGGMMFKTKACRMTIVDGWEIVVAVENVPSGAVP